MTLYTTKPVLCYVKGKLEILDLGKFSLTTFVGWPQYLSN